MGKLVDGAWQGGDAMQIGTGGWEPRNEGIRNWIGSEAKGALPAIAGRYHLIGCPGCPLAHRTAIAHRLKGLGNVISTTVVRPVMAEHGREFGDRAAAIPDAVSGYRYLYEAYLETDPGYTGRASTPVLWDRETRRIVSNNTKDIFAMLNGAFGALAGDDRNFRPSSRAAEIDRAMDEIYRRLTSTVYRCGFARDQQDYDASIDTLSAMIDELEHKLGKNVFLVGDDATEADFMLFASLARYDAIYLPLFRCTTRRIEDQPNITAYLKRLVDMPGVRETFDLRLCMEHYFLTHRHINPTRIVPRPPRLSWHGSATLL